MAAESGARACRDSRRPGACTAVACRRDTRVGDWPIPTLWKSSVAFDADLERYAYGDDQVTFM